MNLLAIGRASRRHRIRLRAGVDQRDSERQPGEAAGAFARRSGHQRNARDPRARIARARRRGWARPSNFWISAAIAICNTRLRTGCGSPARSGFSARRSCSRRIPAKISIPIIRWPGKLVRDACRIARYGGLAEAAGRAQNRQPLLLQRHATRPDARRGDRYWRRGGGVASRDAVPRHAR